MKLQNWWINRLVQFYGVIRNQFVHCVISWQEVYKKMFKKFSIIWSVTLLNLLLPMTKFGQNAEEHYFSNEEIKEMKEDKIDVEYKKKKKDKRKRKEMMKK